jgi:hypothetical protein
MEASNLKKAGILTLIIVVIVIGILELYLRSKDFQPDYDDGNALWSDKRGMVYQKPAETTIFIGSSRIKYDLDIATWEKITGSKAIQLAIEGSSPLPVLEDLANDKRFKGNVIVDVTEGLMFSSERSDDPKQWISYYKEQTPAQHFSFMVNYPLESVFVFLDKNNFSLNAMLGKITMKKRFGVVEQPFKFPAEFGRISFERQNKMMNRFSTDTNLQKPVIGNWLWWFGFNKEKPAEGTKMDSLLRIIKSAADNIKARGGLVLFVRTPSGGPFLDYEKRGFPRNKYWDRLLNFTKCPGIHFEDYPEIAHFICPEWSHLSPKDAVLFTRSLIKILEKEEGWKFPNKQIANIN